MAKIDTSKLKKAYLDAGGDDIGWERNRTAMVEQARQQAAVNEALAEANRKPTLNDMIREGLLGNDNEGEAA